MCIDAENSWSYHCCTDLPIHTGLHIHSSQRDAADEDWLCRIVHSTCISVKNVCKHRSRLVMTHLLHHSYS